MIWAKTAEPIEMKFDRKVGRGKDYIMLHWVQIPCWKEIAGQLSPFPPHWNLLHSYLWNGDTYDVGVNESQTGNRLRPIDWRHNIWPWVTLTPKSQGHHFLTSNISKRWQIRGWAKQKSVVNWRGRRASVWRYGTWPSVTFKCKSVDSCACFCDSVHFSQLL